MDESACVSRIAGDLGNLGVRVGDAIMVHSSFKSLRPVPGGIETVVQGLLLAIGPSGTLLMPALTYRLRPPEVFDPRVTPVIVGAVPEYFRTRPATIRSVHPTHSVCAVGREAHDYLDDHILDDTPCGPHSPFRKTTQRGGKIIMLGCGLKPNTTMHALEELGGVPYVLGQSFLFTIADGRGGLCRKHYVTHGFEGYRRRCDRVAQLGDASFLRRGRVLEAETCLLEAAGLREAVLRKMADDPLCFVEPRN